jgi:ribosome-binding protein aMBF1 (putative translation factor)
MYRVVQRTTAFSTRPRAPSWSSFAVALSELATLAVEDLASKPVALLMDVDQRAHTAAVALVVPAAFSRTAVAGRLGVAESTFRDWETGKARPRQRHAKALARELNVTLEELGLDGEAGQVADHHTAEPGP